MDESIQFFFSFLAPDSATNFQMTQDPDHPDLIEVSWSEPKYITGPLHSYNLFYKEANSDTDWTVLTLPESFSSYRISKLSPGAKYTGYIAPIDANGPGAGSNEATMTTLSGKAMLLSCNCHNNSW